MSDQRILSPSEIAAANPGKHKTYIFGQSSADGTACVGCQWQTPTLLFGPAAVQAHDAEMGLQHDHSRWIPDQRVCPCREEFKNPALLDGTRVTMPRMLVQLAEAGIAAHNTADDPTELINRRKAHSAALAVEAYAQVTGLTDDGDTLDVVLRSLVTDLRHLADAAGIGWASLGENTGYYREIADPS